MNDSKIAVRYGKALFLLSKEKNELEEVAKDMQFLLAVNKEAHLIDRLLTDPTLATSKKKNIVNTSFQDVLNTISLKFLLLLIENKREEALESIARYFLKRYRHFKGIKQAKLTSASPISDTQKATFNQILKETYQSDIELELEENDSLIGGFVLKVDDIEFDGSVKTKLEQVKQYLLKQKI